MSNDSSIAPPVGAGDPLPSSPGADERRIPAFDGLRGIAILLVFIFHIKPPSESPLNGKVVDFIFGPLWCGVDLFFVLSGFLITGILADTKQHARYFLNFYARRTVRIFPLYYGVLGALFVVLPLMGMLPIPQLKGLLAGDYYKALWDNQAWLWLYLQNFLQARGEHQLPGLGHFWSLAIEEQFYLVWPFLVYFLSSKSMLRLAAAIFVMGLPLRWALLHYGFDSWAIRHITFARVDALAAGACVALLYRNCPLHVLRKLTLPLFSVSLIAVLVLAALVPGMTRNSFEVTVWGYTAFAALFSSIIMAILSQQAPAGFLRMLNLRFMTFFGTLSYGIYVFHWPVIHASRAITGRLRIPLFTSYPIIPFALECAITVVVSILLAMLSWKYYEAPWLRLKRRFRYHVS